MEKNYIQNKGKAKGKIYIGLDHGYGEYQDRPQSIYYRSGSVLRGTDCQYQLCKIPGEILCDWREPLSISGKQNRFRGLLYTDFGRTGREVEIPGTS